MKETLIRKIKELCKKISLHKSSQVQCFLKNNPDIRQFCEEEIERLPDVFEHAVEVLQFYFYDYELKYCITCGKLLKFKRFKKGTKFCSCSCSTRNPITQEKLKRTNIEKYGVDHAAKTPQARKKVSEANRANKDVRNAKREETCLKKYGVRTSLLNKEVHEKTIKTNLEKYGTEIISQNEEIKKKKKATFLNHYGVTHYAKTDEFKRKLLGSSHFTKDLKEKMWERMNSFADIEPAFEFSYDLKSGQSYLWRCKHCGTTFNAIYDNGYVSHTCKCRHRFYGSALEDDMFNAVHAKFEDAQQHVYDIIKPFEIDIFIPSINIGIEIDGDFWHNINRKPPMYHFNKSKSCYDKGIRLIHFYEHELVDGRDIVLDTIENYEAKLNELKTGDVVAVDYSKFFKPTLDGYILEKDIDPFIINVRKNSNENLQIENCGFGIYVNEKMKENKKLAHKLDEEIKQLEEELKKFD